MPLEVYRGEDGSYHVEADLPGVDPDSIEVTANSGALTIQAERTPSYRASQQVDVAERSQGSFTRQPSLGEGVDTQKLTADYADGVLHVTIPASPQSQPRRVEITLATGALAAPSRGAQSSRVTRPPEARAAPAEGACDSPSSAGHPLPRLSAYDLGGLIMRWGHLREAHRG